ncbi:hypothetical protein [Luteolibacter sp. Populi]|uniref:hypothetical protein n=1 Tax=Luteolibacter sp. Populi TaxID=3230487 RepID=UPI0034659A73
MIPSPLPVLRIVFALFLLLVPAGAYTLEDPTQLTWDEGSTEAGVNAISQPSPDAGQYYYRLNTRTAPVWRTRLNVTQGEAQLYLAKGQIPTIGNATTRASTRVGSDGIVLATPDFNAGENWYLMVIATGANNAWSLVSGDPYVQDLGNLPFTDINGDGAYNIGEPAQNGGVADLVMGPEGVSFFKATLPPNVPAWALWMRGGQQLVGVRKNQIPALFKPTPLADRKRNGSLLLVPPYLGEGLDSYYVSVKGEPGSVYSMDSRIEPIEDMAFDGTVPNIAVTGSPYRVFRVEVPAEQVIWDLSLTRLSGDPNLCVRKQTVPGENDNDAISEAVGEVNDSITLVSPNLTNGTWFITLFGSGPYTADLKSGTPQITDIGYRGMVQNDQPQRSGWRYYRVPDMGAQLGTLGWQLELADAPPNTKISIRRALAPGTWKQKTLGATSAATITQENFFSTTGILQRVDHEADIWYVGVYQPEVPLGNFTLTLHDIVATTAQVDAYEAPVTGQTAGEWRYFRVIVPEDPALLGWYVDVHSISTAAPVKITVRRDRLPPVTLPTVNPMAADWPSGAVWSQIADFTGASLNANGRDTTGNFFLAATGATRPLKPGTYYVGVFAGQASGVPAGEIQTVSYTLRSRAIGGSYSIPVTPLDFAGGSVTLTDLAPRDFRFYSFNIPQGAEVPSWDLRLTPSVGEMFMQVRRDSLPDFFSSAFIGEAPGVTGVQGGKRLKKPGKERLTGTAGTG